MYSFYEKRKKEIRYNKDSIWGVGAMKTMA